MITCGNLNHKACDHTYMAFCIVLYMVSNFLTIWVEMGGNLRSVYIASHVTNELK
jgi:hypothetical protein